AGVANPLSQLPPELVHPNEGAPPAGAGNAVGVAAGRQPAARSGGVGGDAAPGAPTGGSAGGGPGAGGPGSAGPGAAAPGAPAGTTGPSREQGRFERLRDWHRAAIDRGVAGADGLREMHLRLVANSHVTTSTEIRSIFPPVVGRFADDLAAALSGAAGGGADDGGAGSAQPGAGAHGGPGGPDSQGAANASLGAPGFAHPGAMPPGAGGGVGGQGGTDAAGAQGGGMPGPDTAAAGGGAPGSGAPGPGQGGAGSANAHGQQQAPPAPPKPDLSVAPEGFAPYEFGTTDDEPMPITIRRRPDGSLMLSWSAKRPRAAAAGDSTGEGVGTKGGASDGSGADLAAADSAVSNSTAGPAPVVIDRLISSDEYPPYSPDAARLVVATTGTEGVDDLEFGHAARHFQVWRNVGTSVDDAKLAQPVKYASGELVSPVLDFDLREDEGRVIGQWRVLPGTKRVQVFRIPIQRAAGSSGDPTYRILHDGENLGGFVDATAERGQRYLYQVFAEAEFDGVARLSAPTNQDLLVSAIHEPVRDLSFDLHDNDDEPLFDLSWTTPPGGQVVIFRTQEPPQPGIERNAVNVAALPQAKLPEDRRQSHPIVAEGERESMRQVPWPRGWTRAYFTAVVMLGDMAYVGNTVRGVRVPKVSRPKIVERVNRQVLTFEWPDGADIVLAYSSMTGVSSEIAMQGQPIEVSRSDYREQGGLEFPRGRLDTKGCDLHLVSVAFDGGQRVLAAPEIVTAARSSGYSFSQSPTSTRRPRSYSCTTPTGFRSRSTTAARSRWCPRRIRAALRSAASYRRPCRSREAACRPGSSSRTSS
ncbi:MAG: hypothetical protein ACTH31_16935, partial [Pseudoclavibacter sp.]